jgi:hypothetical protein
MGPAIIARKTGKVDPGWYKELMNLEVWLAKNGEDVIGHLCYLELVDGENLGDCPEMIDVIRKEGSRFCFHLFVNEDPSCCEALLVIQNGNTFCVTPYAFAPDNDCVFDVWCDQLEILKNSKGLLSKDEMQEVTDLYNELFDNDDDEDAYEAFCEYFYYDLCINYGIMSYLIPYFPEIAIRFRNASSFRFVPYEYEPYNIKASSLKEIGINIYLLVNFFLSKVEAQMCESLPEHIKAFAEALPGSYSGAYKSTACGFDIYYLGKYMFFERR